MAAGNNNSGRNNAASAAAVAGGDNLHVPNGIVNSGVVAYGGGGLKRPLQDRDDKIMGQGGPNDPAKRPNLDPSAGNRIKNEPGLGNIEQKYNPSSMLNDVKPPTHLGNLVKPKNEPMETLKQEPIDTKDGILNNVTTPGNKQSQYIPGGANSGNLQTQHNDDLGDLDIKNYLDDSGDGIMTSGIDLNANN